MASTHEQAIELAEMIKKENQKKNDNIPDTDSFIKMACSFLSENERRVYTLIELLRDSHYIFIINLVHPDPGARNQQTGVDAYVYADTKILHMLKEQSESRLEKIYEGTYYKKAGASTVIRELFPKIKTLNNTAVGRAINETVMLEEFLRIINSSPLEYEDSWRNAKLAGLLGEEEEEDEDLEEIDLGDHIEEDDTHPNLPVINPQSPFGKLSGRFSIEMLVRVHFNKFEFETIRRLVGSTRIRTAKQYRYIIQKCYEFEKEAKTDFLKEKHVDKVVELRRFVQAKLNILKEKQQEQLS